MTTENRYLSMLENKIHSVVCATTDEENKPVTKTNPPQVNGFNRWLGG